MPNHVTLVQYSGYENLFRCHIKIFNIHLGLLSHTGGVYYVDQSSPCVSLEDTLQHMLCVEYMQII